MSKLLKHILSSGTYNVPEKESDKFLKFYQENVSSNPLVEKESANIKSLSFSVILNDYAIEHWKEYKIDI